MGAFLQLAAMARRFDITETWGEVYGWSYDIAMVLSQVPLCFMACKGARCRFFRSESLITGWHKGRLIGTCVVIYSLGCIIHTLPVFITGEYSNTIPVHDGTCARGRRVHKITPRAPPHNSDSGRSLDAVAKLELWKRGDELGVISSTGYVCNAKDTTYFVAAFIVARVLMGIGSAPFYTTVICYIDDTVTEMNAVFFIGSVA